MARAKPKRRTLTQPSAKTKAKPKPTAKPKTGQVRGTVDPQARALLDAVLADPTDIQARLVYADFLVERGDPRGEFIHVQCALGRAVVDASGRVHGLDNLYVCDASIYPRLMRANTNLPSAMLAEHLAPAIAGAHA